MERGRMERGTEQSGGWSGGAGGRAGWSEGERSGERERELRYRRLQMLIEEECKCHAEEKSTVTRV